MTEDRIHFVTTGGTIDKDYQRGKGVRDFTIGDPAVERVLDSLSPPPNFEYTVESVLQTDSLDMDDDDRAAVATACGEALSSQVVVTHGTDSMVDTAQILPEDRSIVLTGAARPQLMRRSDAEFNLGTAIAAVQTVDDGVYIAMSGRVYSQDDVEKVESGQFVER